MIEIPVWVVILAAFVVGFIIGRFVDFMDSMGRMWG